MNRVRNRHDKPLTYREFRTGLTYSDVAAMLWRDFEDSAEWNNRSKGAVLRLMSKLKTDMWAEFTGGLRPDEVYYPELVEPWGATAKQWRPPASMRHRPPLDNQKSTTIR